MYLSYYNLKSKPFQMSTDPEFLWLGEKHREALAILKYAVLENKGVLALTGDVGTGKTTLINALLKNLGQDTVTATIYDPRLEVLDFFNTIAAAFKIEGPFDGKGKFLLKFMDFLVKTHERNQRILLIIDESQGINEDLLEEIRLLSNLEAEYTRLLNIFFVGQNEFVDILQKYENRALRQRVTIRYHIEPLSLNETAAYIKYRLEVSGTTAPIFDSGAIDEIYFFSGGYPRLINIMCDHALLSGYVREVQVINANLVRECREELLVSKKTSEKDFHYSSDDYRSLPSETMFSEPSLPRETMVAEPPPDPFIPVEDSHSYEDEQMVFDSWQPMSERAKPIKPSKKSFFRSPIGITLILVVGLVAGYLFYSDDKGTSESSATLAQQQTQKYLSDKAGSENDQPPMASVTSETSDIPSRVETDNVRDSSLLTVKSPNSLPIETTPKETETPQAIRSKQFLEENALRTNTAKPGGPESDGNNNTMEANTAGASTHLPENSLETGSPEEMASATTNPVGTVSSDLRQGVTVIVPITEKTPETIKTTAVEPVEKSETAQSMTKPVQTQTKTSERYQAKSEVNKNKEPESPKNTEMEKEPPVSPPVYYKKQTTTLAAIPLATPPKETVISEKDLARKDKIVSKKKETVQPSLSVPDEKKAVNRVDKKVVSLRVPAGQSKTKEKAGFVNFNLDARLKAFLNEYCRIYEQKDLDKFSTFFALDAVEKGKPFRSWLSKYRQNFNRIESMEYDIELERYATQEETGLVKIDGLFHFTAKLEGSEEWRKSSGQISMVLEADGDSFKVRQLDY